MTRGIDDRDVLADGRYAGLVSRYHAWPMLRPQSVGEHSWQMWRIHRRHWGVPSAAVSELIMTHDAGEIRTGDAPLYAKRDDPELKRRMDAGEERGLLDNGMTPKLEVSERERWRVKACDLLEGLEHTLLDFHMGNRLALPAHRNYVGAIENHLSRVPPDCEDAMVLRSAVRAAEVWSERVTATEPAQL